MLTLMDGPLSTNIVSGSGPLTITWLVLLQGQCDCVTNLLAVSSFYQSILSKTLSICNLCFYGMVLLMMA